MSIPSHLPLTDLRDPFYTGSVQKLYSIPDCPSHMVSETTSRGSVFDVGSIFTIPGSDVSRAVFRHALYSRLHSIDIWHHVRRAIENDQALLPAYRNALLQGPLETLCARGARTHHAGMIDANSGAVVTEGSPEHPSRFNLVRRYTIRKPEATPLLGRVLYDYTAFQGTDQHVIPLEFIVRFGITGASSIFRKYSKKGEAERIAYLEELGVKDDLVPWSMVETPISDCTTKFEPEDRNVSRQEALLLSGLSAPAFQDTLKLGVLGSWAVRLLLDDMGLTLWDIKWEFAIDGADIVFVDTIDTDSFRATRFLDMDGRHLVAHVNKQAVRDCYRILFGDWLAAVNLAKQRSQSEGIPFTEILSSGQTSGDYPPTPELPEAFLTLQEQKMKIIQSAMLQQTEGQEASQALERIARKEVAFYQEQGKLEAFLQANTVA
ncbi:MAG: phosphoribosylaminoimidazolesuccinocarboxamide synthase [Verrucomicrobiota bacterium]